MPVTDADEARVIRLLGQDVAATLGPGHDGLIREAAAHARMLRDDPTDYVEKVVEEVQQEFHDLFLDTTWPACPVHPRHPLWLHDGHWICERANLCVAPLGQLGGRRIPSPAD